MPATNDDILKLYDQLDSNLGQVGSGNTNTGGGNAPVTQTDSKTIAHSIAALRRSRALFAAACDGKFELSASTTLGELQAYLDEQRVMLSVNRPSQSPNFFVSLTPTALLDDAIVDGGVSVFGEGRDLWIALGDAMEKRKKVS